MQGVTNATNEVDQAQQRTTASTRDLVTGFSGVATGAFSLYMSVEQVQRSEVALERAHLMVARANETVEAAQTKYNEAVNRFGASSQQAMDASDKLKIAQDAYTVASDRATMSQQNVNNAMIGAAVMVIPSLITIVSSASRALEGTTLAEEGLNAALEANPIFLVIGAVAALIAILMVAYNTIQPFRDAVDSLGRFLGLIPPAVDKAALEVQHLAEVMAFGAEQIRITEQHWQDAIVVQGKFTNALLDMHWQMAAYDEILTRNCATLEEYRGLQRDASDAVLALEDKVTQLKNALEKTNEALQTEIGNMASSENQLSGFAMQHDRVSRAEQDHIDRIRELNADIESNTALTAAAVAELQAEIVSEQEAADRAKAHADELESLSESYGVLQASSSSVLRALATDYKLAFQSGDIERATNDIQSLADRYKISLSDAEKVIDSFNDKQDELAQKAMDDAKKATDALKAFRDSLLNDYDLMKAKADSSLSSIQASFNAAFNAGDIDNAQKIIAAFATKYGISLNDAKNVIESFKVAQVSATSTVVQTTAAIVSTLDTFTTKITSEYENAKAAADKNLSAIASAFDKAFDAGKFSDAAKVVQSFADKYGITFDQAEQIINRFTDTQKKAFDQQAIDAKKASDVIIEAQQKIRDAMLSNADKLRTDYFDKITSQSDAFQTSIHGLAENLAKDFESTTRMTQSQSIGMTLAIQGLANKWGISWDDMYKQVNDAATKIEAATATIPKSIEDQLIDKAQGDFQKFKDCMTGKALTMKTDVTGHISDLADNITELIKNGLVGEAQNEMQSYVDCNTNKTATMVTDINGMMAKLTTDYNAQLSAMTAEADLLTGAQKDAVLRNIDALTAGYQAKMAQLKAWQSQLLDSMLTDADRAVAAINAAMGAQAAAQAALNVVKPTLTTDIENLPEQVTQTAKAVASASAVFSSGPAVSSGVLPGAQTSLLKALGESAVKPTININAPLVNVEGSADEATVNAAADKVISVLKSVIVEPTSPSAPSTSKIIRVTSGVL